MDAALFNRIYQDIVIERLRQNGFGPRMYSIVDIPESSGFPPVGALLSGRPTVWGGMQIEWSSKSDPIPVFLGTFRPGTEPATPEVFLFGARYNLVEALFDGKALGDGYFLEYFVVQKKGEGNWDLRRLLQRRGVTFSESDDSNDFAPAMEVPDPRRLSVGKPPRWETKRDAVWPTSHGRPMTFLGQIALPETELTRSLFTWAMSIYLFHVLNGDAAFKVVQQDSEM